MIEGYQDAHERLWVPSVANVSHGSRDAVEHAIRHIEAEEAGVAAIGIERSFLPMDAYEALRAELHGVRFVDCTEMLEELRERKRDDELVAKLATAMGEHHQPALAALLFSRLRLARIGIDTVVGVFMGLLLLWVRRLRRGRSGRTTGPPAGSPR
jgi:hypothetical protein